MYRVAEGTQLNVPSDVDPMGFGRGFENEDAEVHLVVRDHGRAKKRNEILPQITAFLDPFCSDPNLLFFAGPNTCADVQFAVFGSGESGEDAVFTFADPTTPVRRATTTLLRGGDILQAVIDTRIETR